MVKRKSNVERPMYDAPEKPKAGTTKFKIELLTSVSNRYTHFPNDEDGYGDDEKHNPENTGKLDSRQSIPLSQVLKLVQKEKLDPSKVFFTASFIEDYLCLSIVHIKKMNDQEQLEEYVEKMAEWENGQKTIKEQELQRIKMQMENLQRQVEALNKKDK